MQTWIEVSRAALRNNGAVVRERTHARLWACVKSRAYGHGWDIIAELESLVDGFCVVSAQEALQLRPLTAKRIVVLNLVEEAEILPCVQAGIELPLADDRQLSWYRDLHHVIRVHVEADVGMNRTGWKWSGPEALREWLATLPDNVQPVGLMAHFSSSDSDEPLTEQQRAIFQEMVGEMRAQFPGVVAHLDNSPAVLHPHWPALDAVRVGGALYGLQYDRHGEALQPVLTWKTRVHAVRAVQADEGVSYGQMWHAPYDTHIATLPVGYADGYPRALSNRSVVLIRGSRCPVRGRICMNMLMVEVGPAVQPGDEVVLIGRQGQEHILADELAAQIDTIDYELLTRLPAEIPRFMR